VANALLDGADAVMLSGETAVGRYPVEAVRVMDNIGWVVQEQITQRDGTSLKALPVADVVGELAARSVDAVEPAAIIVVTRSGFSALMVSKYRPKTKILAVTREPRIGRRLHMYWGVEPLDVPWTDNIVGAVHKSLELGYVYDRDIVAVVSGSTLIEPGKTTTLDILSVKDILARWDHRD